ncbi:pirin [Mycobacterium sp. CBMA 234]|nr:pirin [Mycolicibacterium sp. CBMA 234]
MSNLEAEPVEFDCAAGPPKRIEILEPREVPLGGPRAMQVRRTLPQRERSLVGAWCFVDHYGPEDVRTRPGMDVAPHPHTGLQTVSWLFSGEIEHRDSHGVHEMVRPGELNLMSAGAGICHSEVSTPATTILHGVQLWVALPDSARHGPRHFDHYAPQPVSFGGAIVSVFLGELAGQQSPVHTHTPLLGAQVDLPGGNTVEFEVDPTFEHAVLLDQGTLTVAGTPVRPYEMAYQGVGFRHLALTNTGTEPARAVVLGGTPFTEELLMWWNFVGRTHDEIVEFRNQWQAESERFGEVIGYQGEPARLPAPPLPTTRLIPRQPPTTGKVRVMLTDKNGAPVEVTQESDRFGIGVDGKSVGLTAFIEHGEQRVFYHTEIDPAYGGRGLASVLIAQALKTTREQGKRIVAICPMVKAYVEKHHDFDDILDPRTPEILRLLPH